jgi:SspJ family small acid-soluble spore protein
MVRADPGKTEDDVARVQGALDDADAALAKVDAP